ncbi:hypothetical protein DICVIV_04778 [Dictyocaulus viviparus]|uniref:Uncharacterized protein n=1 Tax=Dictyocaulus viviparus TaxID=29172 RepID=A0A0D8Y3B4_DICVI|nr:hypothetical protein DICVIV_04778 [Dictyocaulus viviparus]
MKTSKSLQEDGNYTSIQSIMSTKRKNTLIVYEIHAVLFIPLNHWLDHSYATCQNAKFEVNGRQSKPCCCTKRDTITTWAIIVLLFVV